MDYTINERLKNAWNAFKTRGPSYIPKYTGEISSYYRPDQKRYLFNNERSIVFSCYNRIALDVVSVDIRHTRNDEDERFIDVIHDSLDNILTLDANIDQTGKAFLQDLVMSMFDEGCVAVVPIDTAASPINKEAFEILTVRVGKITQWYPSQVRVRLYNERNGQFEEVTVPKHICAIIQNPFYAVMNQPNSTAQRLIRKLNILDQIDDQSVSGKLDMIIQLPYQIRTDQKREQAEQRRKDIELQLTSSKYGIAYTDGTEKIVQLNRPIENNLLPQIQDLKKQLYSELGLSEEIMNHTASEQVMQDYYNRTIEPVLDAICDEFKRKFLSKTARTQGQSISYLMNPLKLATTDELTKLGEAFTRSEILSSNEVRGFIGFRPVDTPEANELRNKNLNRPAEEQMIPMDENGQEYLEEPQYEDTDYGDPQYYESY